MEREELRRILRQLVEEETGDPCPELEPEMDLRVGLNMDSMDLVSLLFRIENRLKVKLASEQFAEVATVGQLLDLLHQMTANSPQAQAA
jgi:acyl carrier protein